MPVTPRKSSIDGSRRGIQKAHIPYRGDNPDVGKKRGILIPHAELGSDGIEPFDEVMKLGYARAESDKKRRRKQSFPVDDVEMTDDEDGEISMEVDSPIQHVLTNSLHYTPSRRVGSSSRPVARSSDVDFDRLPSPKPRASSSRDRQPSRLSYSIHAPDIEDDEPVDPDSSLVNQFDDYVIPPDDSPQQHTSFAEIANDDEEEDEEMAQPDPVPTPKANNKKKRNSPTPPSPAGIVNLDMNYDAEEQEETPRPKKKANVARATDRNKKENREVVDGTRRGTRKRFAPLDFWRGEKVTYGRPSHGRTMVPNIREIIRIPKEEPPPLGTHKRGARRKPHSSRSKSTTGIEAEPQPYNPEEGWDKDTNESTVVRDYKTGEEIERQTGILASGIDPQQVANGDWQYHKIFSDETFIAAGFLVIPPHCVKPSKMAKDNTYIFYVAEGAVQVMIHRTRQVYCTGASFMVPRGNQYAIANVCERDAKIFFTQGRQEEIIRTPSYRSSSAMGPLNDHTKLKRSATSHLP